MKHKYEATIILLGEKGFNGIREIIETDKKFKSNEEVMDIFSKKYPDNLSISLKYTKKRNM